MDGPAEISPDRVEYATEPICFHTLHHPNPSTNQLCGNVLNAFWRLGFPRSDAAD
jgi:hypothetical protein